MFDRYWIFSSICQLDSSTFLLMQRLNVISGVDQYYINITNMNEQLPDLLAVQSIVDVFRDVQGWFLIVIFCFIGLVIIWGMIKHR
jgi:hypothetical protein